MFFKQNLWILPAHQTSNPIIYSRVQIFYEFFVRFGEFEMKSATITNITANCHEYK